MEIYITLKEKETNRESKRVKLEDIIFNRDEVVFEFDNKEENIVETLPYNDFLFYRDEYTVLVACDLLTTEYKSILNQ